MKTFIKLTKLLKQCNEHENTTASKKDNLTDIQMMLSYHLGSKNSSIIKVNRV